jgi:hypothetical protein
VSYYQGNASHPQHLSFGAILVNGAGEVCCHHFRAEDLKGYWTEQGLDDFYLLMRATPEPNEAPEAAILRGLREEFGATAEIVDYVGSIQSRFAHRGVEVEKTTAYFLCRLIDQDPARREGDIESKTALEWRAADFLIPRMREQAARFGRTDVDESAVLERAKAQGYLA